MVKVVCKDGHINEKYSREILRDGGCFTCKKMNFGKEKFLSGLKKEGYKLLEEYKGSHKIVEVECNSQHRYKVRPKTFNEGFRCAGCSGKSVEKAKKDFYELLEKNGDKSVGEYKGTAKPVKIICSKGHSNEENPIRYKKRGICKDCFVGKHKQIKMDFIEEVTKYKYEMMEDYKRLDKEIELKCKKGHIIRIKPKQFLKHMKCEKCEGITKKRKGGSSNYEKSKLEFSKLTKEFDYKMLDGYKGSNVKVLLRCQRGHECEIKPAEFKRGKRCNKCDSKSLRVKKQFMKNLVECKMEMLSNYENAVTKVKLRCENNHIFLMDPGYLNTHKECKKCKIEKKEEYQKKKVERCGFTILGDYKNIKTKLLVECEKGHKSKIRISEIKEREENCLTCYEILLKNQKRTFEIYTKRNNMEIEGEFSGYKKEVELVCEKGHVFKIKPMDFFGEGLCVTCQKRNFENGKEVLIKKLKEKDAKIISTFERMKDKITVICSDGHTSEMIPNNINRWSCTYCSGRNPQVLKEKFDEVVLKSKMILLSEYVNSTEKVKLQCNLGHIFSDCFHLQHKKNQVIGLGFCFN